MDIRVLSEKVGRLYEKRGYEEFRLSKFEEYDLYAKNKDFLVSDRIITFTDTNGRLLALKPDVTLSILKAVEKNDVVSRYYYSENVYRPAKGTGFKEIPQLGLELIGKLDEVKKAEVLTLAIRTLKATGKDFLVDISSLSLIEDILAGSSLETESWNRVMDLLGEKNEHEMEKLLDEKEIAGRSRDILLMLTTFRKGISEGLEILKQATNSPSIKELEDVFSLLEEEDLENLRLDFSVNANRKYYNGIVFSGFIEGASESVLSGGEYTRLLANMKRKEEAMGFALYADRLENTAVKSSPILDYLVLYSDKTDRKKLLATIKELEDKDQSFILSTEESTSFKYNDLLDLRRKV